MLGKAGVPHDDAPTGVFFQELFARWLQYTAFVTTGRIPVQTYGLNDQDPDMQLGHDAGVYTGATIAGYDDARRELEAWMASPGADLDQVALARLALSELSHPLTVDAVVQTYRRARSAS